MRTGVRSSTSDSLMNRIAVEREMMGIPANAGNNKTPAYGFLTTKEAVPSYWNSIMGGQGPRGFGQGSIDEFNQILNPMSRYLERYGANTIILKPKALGKATMSFGDSLSIWDKALRLKAKTPKVNKFKSLLSSYPRLFGTLESTQNMMMKDIKGIKSPTKFPYIETHLPGGFTPKDIESIIINPSGKFLGYEKEKIAAEMAERMASTRALLDSLGLKNVKVNINEGIKIGDEALEKLKVKTPAGQYVQSSMADYPLPKPFKRFAQGGFAMGTDTVPAMLTPGEFVIKKSAVDRIGTATLNKINGYAQGGVVGGNSSSTSVGDSVYNYSINVNVATDSDPNQIARAVMTQIRKIDNNRVRGSSF
jgi:hypothetical protein